MDVRWYEVFDAALESSDVIAVRAVVEDYLRRKPTRSEITSARRAANRYAESSTVLLLRIAPGGRGGSVVLLARSDADLDDLDRLLDVAEGRKGRGALGGGGTANRPQHAESVIGAVVKSARSTTRVRVVDLEPSHAALLAIDLSDAIAELRSFERRLRIRGRWAVSGPSAQRITPES